MKYWCYYTDVVRYLERIEALYSPKKAEAPAYLVWQDDEQPVGVGHDGDRVYINGRSHVGCDCRQGDVLGE